MTAAGDPTGELIRGMLERRANVEPVPSLVDQIVRSAAATAQGRPRARAWLLAGVGSRVALVAAAVLAVGVLAVSALAVGALLRTGPAPDATPPAGLIAASPAQPSAPDASSLSGITPRPVPAGFAPDTLAAVTPDGTRLRVRSAPGLGSDSKLLEPLLRAGTRMLVISGPVEADGYEWYEVMTDGDPVTLYGWVAAGKDGVAWIGSTPPRCPDTVDNAAVATLNRMDWLVCYGDADVSFEASGVGIPELHRNDCPWTGGDRWCGVSPAWFEPTMWMSVRTHGTRWEEMMLAVDPSLDPTLASDADNVVYTIVASRDRSEARDCALAFRSGAPAAPEARAVLECRLTFVATRLEARTVQLQLSPRSVATVVEGNVEVWPSPVSEGTPSGVLSRGTRVYVDVGPTEIQGADWYAVLALDGEPAYGWVSATSQGPARIVNVPLACPDFANQETVFDAAPADRYGCLHEAPHGNVGRVISSRTPAPPPSDACDAYRRSAAASADVTCEATPAWLATSSGLRIRRPNGVETPFTVDPQLVDPSTIPATETSMWIFGAYDHPASETCRVRDAETGEDLLPPAVAAIYCRLTFVASDLEPATTSP